jgi:hypothetical protein
MPPMTVDRWSRDLAGATSESEVIYVVRDFRAMLSRAEIARLPEPCRPPAIRDSDDVSSWGIELLRAKLAICPDTDNAALIIAVESFLSAAMHRLSELEFSGSDDLPVPAKARHLDS